MKIKVACRSLDDHMPASLGAPAPLHRNLDPSLHPHMKSREYSRAVTASKLNRMFAKPFVDQLEGHRDGVYTMCMDPKMIGRLASGSGDGDVRVWDLESRSCVTTLPNAHKGKVSGVTFLPSRVLGEGRSNTYDRGPVASSSKLTLEGIDDDDEDKMEVDDEVAALRREALGIAEEEAKTSRLGSRKLLSCGSDKTVKLWDVGGASSDNRLLTTYYGRLGFNSVDHHSRDAMFATASDSIHIWDINKTSPVLDLSWDISKSTAGTSKSTTTFSGEHMTSVTFSPSENALLASSGSDRSICLYDVRAKRALGRVIMGMRINSLKFNPMQPAVLLAASEDHQLYTFDIRNLSSATQVFKDHVAAVMSCDWSPTGREFISGSYDCTLRIWNQLHGRSRESYHTKRMQRIFSSTVSMDSRFALTGSDDGGIRLWKMNASEKLGVLNGREKAKLEYGDLLREHWKGVGQVSKLERQRYLPKSIYNAQKLRITMLEAQAKKEDNRRSHRKRGVTESNPRAERKKQILQQQT